MWLLVVGLVAIGLKYFAVGFFAGLAWWIVLLPFPAAMLWWAFADWSGYTARRAMERDDARKQARIDRQRDVLGLTTRARSAARRKP
ncbi:MAG: TIGR04438 family Trp-rich protein [Gammaproteobacteria bacterium]|uniref:TIGR04438 family Trp-rich protein n=1 Tax=unclassified Pseudacidovorax TaxID=2620592 RepID=UPI001B4FADC2|nr:TIGR04438 family Trp-rich protein [Pseudacidovorax sp.]MBP6898246.1 TIGR04438 family Trp-rich protein [Pseudacidovorax sp.]